MSRSTHDFDERYARAVEQGALEARTQPRAVSARYDPETGRIEVELRNGCLFAFPAHLAQGLGGATPEQLAKVEVLPTGYGLHWEELDADLSVPGLMQGVFGTAAWMRELGQAGGRVRSPAKAAAARENGRKGGRPRKRSSSPAAREG
ncbi:MAG TPA: DUF2442 domain-containing protein [Longimicrobiaceae bacterium]|nr:DUF2442 domain-containing protein [Longimicrobiaceae bacterium]